MKRSHFFFNVAVLLFCLGTQVTSVNAQLLCKQFNCLTATPMPESHGAEMRLQFTLAPQHCGAQCSCDKIVFIQAARAKDLGPDGNWIYPDEILIPPDNSLADSTELGGWFVDGQTDCGFGYYGAEGAESGEPCPKSLTFNPDFLTMGHADGSAPPGPAELYDLPLQHPNQHVEFVDVPVCISGTFCNNSIFGFYTWWFIDKKTDLIEPFKGPFHGPGLPIHSTVLEKVTTHWNHIVTGLRAAESLEPFPKFKKFP